jgi:hypothetical protein
MKALPICWGDGPPPAPGVGWGEGLGDGSADITTLPWARRVEGGATMEKDLDKDTNESYAGRFEPHKSTPLYNCSGYFRLGGNPFLCAMFRSSHNT